MKTPVAFIIFNRPDTTKRVFEAIRQAKPPKLLVIADGPRADHPGEAEKCAAARAIIEGVDWECEVLTNYSDVNLGCKIRVSSGLDWVFETVEEAIILEDDCLPHSTFFPFCEELLSEYRFNEQIMHIAGTNLTPIINCESSFLFSRLVPIWGWATWSRSWKYYDIEMKLWSEYKLTTDIEYFKSEKLNVFKVFENHYNNNTTQSWDGRWAFSCTENNGLSIIPKYNLVQNIGFGENATHTTRKSKLSSIPVKGLEFPLIKPLEVNPDSFFDVEYLKFANRVDILVRIKRFLKKILIR